jgi:CheY-like chemotaxis protein
MAAPAILYAEDNRILLQAVKDVLEMAGRHIEKVHEGCMALAMIEDIKRYDLCCWITRYLA